LFNVMLGSMTSISQTMITGNNNLWLGITVGTDDEMLPRVQLGSVPFAMQALTVPNGSVTTAKIATGAITTTQLMDKAVTQAKLGADVSLIPPDGSITTAKIAAGAVTSAKIADGNVTTADLADGAVTQAKAPTLLKDGIGTNNIIQFGDVVLTNDASGWVNVSFPSCFPNRTDVFTAVNGDYGANSAYVVGHQNYGNACGSPIKLSVGNTNQIRINWIAIGH
jgi:hypothetical protein